MVLMTNTGGAGFDSPSHPFVFFVVSLLFFSCVARCDDIVLQQHVDAYFFSFQVQLVVLYLVVQVTHNVGLCVASL